MNQFTLPSVKVVHPQRTPKFSLAVLAGSGAKCKVNFSNCNEVYELIVFDW